MVVTVVAAATATPARATLLGVTVADASSGNYTLTSLSLTRGSGGTLTYLPGQLIGVDLTDVAAVQLPLAVQSGASLPATGTRAALLEDGRLDTGVINPFSTGAAPEDSFEVTFRSPVVNSAGDDLVVLEIGTGDPTRFWVNNDRTGHGVDVAASNFTGSLLSGMPFTLYSYNNAGDQNVNDLAELESSVGFTFNKNDTGTIAGIALDLSSFGIPLGSSVSSLRFQSIGATSRIDPVYIAGLPPVPVPGDANLDGIVNADDYALLDRGYNRYLTGRIPANRAGWTDGDFNYDGLIDQNDYLLIDSTLGQAQGFSPGFLSQRESQFGATYVSTLLASIPEPSSLPLLAACGLALLPLTRHRRT
jgi:hypothetical protein